MMAELTKQVRFTSGVLRDRFMLTTPEDIGKEIRIRAKKEGLSFSAFIYRAVIEYLENHKGEKSDG